jgi:hypothetical protein
MAIRPGKSMNGRVGPEEQGQSAIFCKIDASQAAMDTFLKDGDS